MTHLFNKGVVGSIRNQNNVKISQPKINSNKNSNSLSRKSSSVRNYRGRKYTEYPDTDSNQQYFLKTTYKEANLSAYVNKQYENAKNHLVNNNVNHTISYNNDSKAFSRSKTNSKKRGAVILRGKDSRNIPSNPKTRKENHPEQDGIKTIEYGNKDNMKSIQARSITAQK